MMPMRLPPVFSLIVTAGCMLAFLFVALGFTSAQIVFDSDLRASSSGAYAVGTALNSWSPINSTLFFTTLAYVGVGSSVFVPTASFQVRGGDIYIADPTRGVIFVNGSCYRYTVSSTGAYVKSSITCP
jgi:hypothetical protein